MQGQRKASNTTTSEIVLESLREQIINGTLQPQEKLIEAEIAQKFGLSRGPVREALRQLAVEGLVDYCPNKGCTVALLSPQDAYEVFFLRDSLEKLAIQKSNCRLSDYDLMIMEASIEEFRKAILAGNTMKAVHADETFHQQIIRSAQLNRLTKMWELLSPLNGAMFLSVQNANRFGQLSGDAETLQNANCLESNNTDPSLSHNGGAAVWTHQCLLEAIRNNDLQTACALLDQHYEGTSRRVYRLSLMKEQNF